MRTRRMHTLSLILPVCGCDSMCDCACVCVFEFLCMNVHLCVFIIVCLANGLTIKPYLSRNLKLTVKT